MLVDEFRDHARILTAMTRDFMAEVPEASWDWTPLQGGDARGQAVRPRWSAFAPLSRQFRHVVRARGVYNSALARGRVDWSVHREQYAGPSTRTALLSALDAQQQTLESLLDTVDPQIVVDWSGTPFTFGLFAGEFVQHEAIHHGQWSVYAALGGFDTPASWHASWDL